MAGADWQAGSFRVVLFTQQALPITTDVFAAFAGEPPEIQEDRPKEGVRRQIGKLDDARLRANITPIMVDFTLEPEPPTAENVMGGVSLTFGKFEIELAKLERKTLAWLPKWEVPTTRVSLVIQARAPASSTAEAYEILRDNLSSVKVRPGEMSDMIFRVNWKAKTDTIPEGYYNRLTTWSALTLRATAAPIIAGAPELTLSERDFAQVEMDINTPAERASVLPREKLTTIYKELFQLALKIAEVGEVREF